MDDPRQTLTALGAEHSPLPPGWTYNPSSWKERGWIIAVGVAGFLLAGYLALYQVGLIGWVWEPWFGDGSRIVLHSSLSRVLPIPDAALGALAYLLDAVTGAIGGPDRWRKMPWMVRLMRTGPPLSRRPHKS